MTIFDALEVTCNGPVEPLKNQIKSNSSIEKQSILNEYYQLLNKREQLRRQLLKEKQDLYQQYYPT